MSRPLWHKSAVGIIVVLVLAFPQLGVKSYYLHIAILGLINALLVLGLNVIAGYTGQLSLGQAAFSASAVILPHC